MSVDQGVRGHVAPDRGDRSQPSRLQRNYAVLHLLLEKLRQLVGSDFQSSGETVLDFGSGSRPYESLLRTKFRRYLAADFPGNDEADVTICPEGRLSLPDQEFDCVLSTQVLEHVEDPRVYLGEAYRVLKPGGTLVLSTHGIWRYHPDPLDHWRWTADGLRLEICRAGFEMEGLESVLGLAGCALQLWQDATTGALPRVVRPLYYLVIQALIVALERLRGGRFSPDACLYVVVARRPRTGVASPPGRATGSQGCSAPGGEGA